MYKRIKTRKRESVPLVSYKLWPETIDSLAETRSDHLELWFTTEDGLPLKTSSLVGDRESKWSAFSKQWRTWQLAGFVPRPQKGLRKTGANFDRKRAVQRLGVVLPWPRRRLWRENITWSETANRLPSLIGALLGFGNNCSPRVQGSPRRPTVAIELSWGFRPAFGSNAEVGLQGCG